MKLTQVTEKDWYKWYTDFRAEIADEEQKLRFENFKNITGKDKNITYNEWFEWDGTSQLISNSDKIYTNNVDCHKTYKKVSTKKHNIKSTGK